MRFTGVYKANSSVLDRPLQRLTYIYIIWMFSVEQTDHTTPIFTIEVCLSFYIPLLTQFSILTRSVSYYHLVYISVPTRGVKKPLVRDDPKVKRIYQVFFGVFFYFINLHAEVLSLIFNSQWCKSFLWYSELFPTHILFYLIYVASNLLTNFSWS